MKLEEIKRPYDLIVSLGSACAPAAHLRRHGLRRFSMPLDWVVSSSLSDVNRLMRNRFAGFMQFENLRLIDGHALFVENEIVQPVPSYFVKDTYFNILSVHDFPVLQDQEWSSTYPSYKEKLDRRIARFLDHITKSHSVLFVRWNATYDEVVELHDILSEMVSGDFCLLVIIPADDLTDVVELNWNLDRVCPVIAPNDSEDPEIWDYILKGISLS